MSILMFREIDGLKKMILELSAMVEEALHQSIKAVDELDTERAQKVIEKDEVIDAREIDVEEECLKILALHQPVAADLRYIIAILKINNDLERVGDLCVNISQRAKTIANYPGLKPLMGFREMTESVSIMVKKSIDALINLDMDMAVHVCEMDDNVDKLRKLAFKLITERIKKDSSNLDYLFSYMSVSRYLERIADHATNIAQDVMYMIKGEIVRHSHGTNSPGSQTG